jgi:hypothetical protein
MASLSAPAPSARPLPVTVALVLFLLVVGNVIGPLLPSSEGEVVFGIVSALIGLMALVGLWLLRKWGFIATIVVAALNLLSDVPAGVAAASAPIKLLATVHALLCAAIIVLVSRPEARRAHC